MLSTTESLELRVDIDGTKGTLVVTKDGLGFKRPNQKKPVEAILPWDKIPQAFDILKNVPGFIEPVKGPTLGNFYTPPVCEEEGVI
jgi:hypothetical protein